MSWIRRVLAAVTAALLLALGSQPSLAASAPADSDLVHAYVYDAHVIPDVVAKGAPERGPPTTLTTCTSAPAVDTGSYGRFARRDGGIPAVPYAYDGISQLAQAGDSSSTGAKVVPGSSGELSALRLAGVAAETGGEGVLRHYTTTEASQLIEKSGTIEPGLNSGKIWLTPDEYPNGAVARSRLALDKTPDGYYEVPRGRIQEPSGPGPVEPWNGEPGGGTEITTRFPIDIGGLTFNLFGGG